MSIKKILVSQPKPTSDKNPYSDIAAKHNVEIVFRSFIKVEGLSSKEFRQQKINLADYTAIIFTSRHAVDNFFRLCEENRVSVPDTMRYFCLSEAIALYLQKYIVYRKRKISFGLTGKIDDPQLVAALQKNHKEKFLLPVAEVHNSTDLEFLKGKGYDVTEAVMFRTVSNDFGPDEAFDYDMLIFFSPIGIQSLRKNFPDFEQKDTVIATFGTQAAKAVEEAGLRLDLAAPTPQAPSMSGALDQYLTEKNGD
ncbi:MAG: uroporphyrinogen-III synthase [Bacteroidales bacterium]|nr:uroporphyrinogen-III synthase [Bacteroidales bacterium]